MNFTLYKTNFTLYKTKFHILFHTQCNKKLKFSLYTSAPDFGRRKSKTTAATATSTTDSKVRVACFSGNCGIDVSRCAVPKQRQKIEKIPKNSAVSSILNNEDKMTTSSSDHLLNRIKERLLMMDLINQMDKAKELTHFVLTHQAIPREDKE